MKRTISVVMAAALMLASVPVQGSAEEIIMEDYVETEALNVEPNDNVSVNELTVGVGAKTDGIEAEETKIIETEGIEENTEQGQPDLSEMPLEQDFEKNINVTGETAFDDSDTVVQDIEIVEIEDYEEIGMPDEMTDFGAAMDDGIMQTALGDQKINVLDVNTTYKLTDLDRSDFDYKSQFCIDFTTSGAGRIKIRMENIQSPDLYYLNYFRNYGIGDMSFTQGLENVTSNWTCVTEGTHSLCISYRYGLATEAEATITILYEEAGKYDGESEPNNSYDTAKELKSGVLYWGNRDCSDRGEYYDYYSFELDKPDRVEIYCDSCSATGLYSEDENGNVSYLTSLANTSYRLKEGKYYIRVLSTYEARMEYSIKVEKMGETADAYEQEDNNLSSKANLLNCNAWYTGNINEYYGDNRLIDQDIDWLRFEVPEKSVIQLQTKIPRQTTGSLMATLYNGVLSELSSLTTDSNPYKETDQLIVDAGTYYVKIVGKDIPQTSWDYSVCLSQEKFVPVTDIDIPETLQLLKGKSQILPASILPADASIKTLKWESSNERVVSVDDSGMLTAEAVGEATIIAEAKDGSGIVGTCKVVVGREIVYNLQGGVNNPENPTAYYNGTITLKNPTREGYRFLGWYRDKWYNYEKVDTITEEGPFELYAGWEEAKTITYMLNGGVNNPENPEKFYGDEIVLKEPTRPGYVFYIWADQFSNPITKITKDTLTVYAVWHKICTINYVMNEGTNNKRNPSTFVEGEEINLFNPTRPGYKFTGWYKNAKLTSRIMLVYEDATVYAGWEKVKTGKAGIKSLVNKSGKKAVLKLKKVKGAKGYEVVYSTNKRFKKNVKTKTTRKLSITLKKLTRRKTYYVKVRAYKTDSTGIKVYGKYSKVKKVKIRR